MWPFNKKGDGEKTEAKKAEVDYSIQDSFHRVRTDMDNVNTWLNFFYKRDTEMHQSFERMHSQISQLSSKIDVIPVSAQVPAEFHTALARINEVEGKIEQFKISANSPEPLLAKVAELNSKLSLVEETQKDMREGVFERLRNVSSRMEKLEQTRTRTGFNLREKIVKKVAKNSKEYIKNIVLSTIEKYGEISALNLREMIVEEQGLCSKSTFYRILEEIEVEEKADMVAKGKEKIYLPRVTAKH